MSPLWMAAGFALGFRKSRSRGRGRGRGRRHTAFILRCCY